MVLTSNWMPEIRRCGQFKRTMLSTKHRIMKVDFRSVIFSVIVFVLLYNMIVKRKQNVADVVFDSYSDYEPVYQVSEDLKLHRDEAVQQFTPTDVAHAEKSMQPPPASVKRIFPHVTHTDAAAAEKTVQPAPVNLKTNQNIASMESKFQKYKQKKCSIKPPAKRKNIKPLIHLDRSKFLFPLLVNGPNNQILGLRDSIYLAIRLNRTLIIPYFIKHKTDSTGAFDQVPAEARMDVEALSYLIPTVPHSQLQSVCRGKVDTVFLTEVSRNMHASLPHERIAKLTDLTVAKPDNSNTGVERLPLREQDLNIKLNDINVPKLRNTYKSKGRCAVYVHPFRTVGAHESSPKMREAKFILDDYTQHAVRTVYDFNDDELIYSLGFMSTGHPFFVKQIGDDFYNRVMSGASVLSVHYRFDPNDWMLRCAKPDGNTNEINEMCEKLLKIKPVDIANGLFAYISEVGKRGVQVQAIYFAAPLTLSKLISQVRVMFDRNVASNYGSKIPIYTYMDLEKHLRNYMSCQFVESNFEDVLSLVEMEICLKSKSFISSQSSSWSNIVMRHRVANKVMRYDSHTIAVIWKAYLERTEGKS